MDAVNFIKERQRLCKQMSCEKCGLRRDGIECGNFNLINEPERLVSFIEQWSEEHPRMTNRQKFKEVFGIGPEFSTLEQFHDEWFDTEYELPEED